MAFFKMLSRIQSILLNVILYMKSLLSAWILLFSTISQVLAAERPDGKFLLWDLSSSILPSDSVTGPVVILTLIQSILLKVVLPVIVVWASLYIAYELFTADGDESKLKKAWKSIAYTAIALISIALSYALVSIVSGLSF